MQVAESLEPRVEVETPEQVVFSYEIAGVGTRAAAAMLDYALCVLPGALIAGMILSWAGGSVRALGEQRSAPTYAALAVLLLGQFAALWGYHVLFEALNDGQTPGKRRYGLRVVQDGGFPVSFGAAAIRNVARAVDMQPGAAYVVGMLCVGLSRSGKRIGDMLAGTIVVRERPTHVAIPAAGVSRGPAPVSTRLTEDEYSLLERFVARRQDFDLARRQALAGQIAVRVGDRLVEAGATGAVEADLVRLYGEERAARAAGAASHADAGARRETNAILAAGMPRWRVFADRLRDAQGRGLRSLSEEQLRDFVAEYRAISTDLARLATAARDRPLDAQYYLSRLVAGAHNLLYRRRRDAAVAVGRYIEGVIPTEVRRAAPYILCAAVTMFGSAAIAFVATDRDPQSAREFLPAAMIERAESAELRGRSGAGYVDVPEPFQPLMASGIIANNVQVTYGVFALGITAGIGTALLLLFNGIAVGGFAGLYTSTGQGLQLLAFVAPHGVLELSAITIAGGAGFLIAAALLLPGDRTRREALVENGRRAINLVACATMLLIVAGTIEGLISPRGWPIEWKLLVSATTLALLAAYLGLGGRDAVHAPVRVVNTGQPARPVRSLRAP